MRRLRVFPSVRRGTSSYRIVKMSATVPPGKMEKLEAFTFPGDAVIKPVPRGRPFHLSPPTKYRVN